MSTVQAKPTKNIFKSGLLGHEILDLLGQFEDSVIPTGTRANIEAYISSKSIEQKFCILYVLSEVKLNKQEKTIIKKASCRFYSPKKEIVAYIKLCKKR